MTSTTTATNSSATSKFTTSPYYFQTKIYRCAKANNIFNYFWMVLQYSGGYKYLAEHH